MSSRGGDFAIGDDRRIIHACEADTQLIGIVLVLMVADVSENASRVANAGKSASQ